jgi:hypothetical protein
MSKGIGRLLSIGIAKEAVRGTAQAAADFWVPFMEASLEEKDSKAIDEQAIGVIEGSTDEKIVKQWAEFSMKGIVGDKHFPLFLFSTLGNLVTVANPDVSGVVKDHTITVAEHAQHQSLTLFLKEPLSGQDYKHALGMVEDLELNYERGKFIEYSVKMKAQKGAATSNTVALLTENKFLPQYVTFKLATNQAGLSATSPTIIKSLKLKINTNMEDDDVLGSISPIDFLNRKFSIEGELEAIWQNETDFKNFVLAGTSKAMRIDLKNTDVAIGAAARPEIVIDLYKVIFSELTHPFKINDLIMQTLRFKAHYSIADAKMVQVVCTNTQGSY